MTHPEQIYTLREPEPGIIRIGNSGAFMDMIVGEHHALLFDTGYGFGDLKSLVRAVTDKPLYVVNSHGHVDHACGNAQFGSAYIHPLDFEQGTLVQAPMEYPGETRICTRGGIHYDDRTHPGFAAILISWEKL